MGTGGMTSAIRPRRLAEIVDDTIGRGGTVVIPAFAVGRAQSLMFHLQQLKAHGRLSNVPIFLDSPMAEDASDIFCHDSQRPKASGGACRRACARRALCPQRGGVEGPDRQSDAEGDHLGERNGDRRTCRAPSQALRARPAGTPFCSPASRPAGPVAPP